MTHKDKELVFILRKCWMDHPELKLAADRIEAQEVEIERLQDALKRIAGGWPKPMQLARETLEK